MLILHLVTHRKGFIINISSERKNKDNKVQNIKIVLKNKKFFFFNYKYVIKNDNIDRIQTRSIKRVYTLKIKLSYI